MGEELPSPGLTADLSQWERNCPHPALRPTSPSGRGVCGNPNFAIRDGLHVEVLDLEGVFLDEAASLFDVFAHQQREEPLGLLGLLGRDPAELAI